jgi:2-polyprenyl-6-methoxyphenol hydroxylase-like FAD-dependent oxidoreductase
MKILISGAGIAGSTLAYWLARYGFQPTIIEKAPQLRTAGYMIDFWGAGMDVAGRMGLIPEIRRKGYVVQEVRVVNSSGKRVAGFSPEVFARAAQGGFISLPRGDLAASIFSTVEGKIETIFGDSIARMDQEPGCVRVAFEYGPEREFDLVIGADGLHSNVRELVFGVERNFEKYLGYVVAAFTVDNYSRRDELVYVMYTEVHQQVARFSMRDGRTMFLFVFAENDAPSADGDFASHKAILRKRFGNSGWECPQILDALDACRDLYFDRVSQIRMNREQGLWTKGRVTLVGDAASCVSFLAGQGSALAMVAAYILAGELYQSGGDYHRAFASYQELFAPFVLEKQKAALRLAGFFAPKSQLALFLRNQVMNLLAIPWVVDLAVARELTDKIALPEYAPPL